MAVVPDTPLARALSGLFLLGGATASLVPNLAFFQEKAPPLFEDTTLLTSGLAVVLLYYGWTRRPRRPVRNALVAAIAGLALMVSYRVAHGFLTVSPPEQRGGEPVQIGFHMARWSLTPKAMQVIDEPGARLRIDTPELLMLTMGGWEKGKVPTIWQGWSIVTAGLLLIGLFSAGFVCWTFAFGLLAGYVAEGRAPRAPPAAATTSREVVPPTPADEVAATRAAPDPAAAPAPPAPVAKPHGSPRLRIVRLVPRPSSNQRRNEAATLRNDGKESVDLRGWTLTNGRGQRWALDELTALAPGAEGTIYRNGKPMSLRDSGDTIQLRDEHGTVRHEARYGKVAVDEEVLPD